MNYINEQVNKYNNIQYELYKWTSKEMKRLDKERERREFYLNWSNLL